VFIFFTFLHFDIVVCLKKIQIWLFEHCIVFSFSDFWKKVEKISRTIMDIHILFFNFPLFIAMALPRCHSSWYISGSSRFFQTVLSLLRTVLAFYKTNGQYSQNTQTCFIKNTPIRNS